MKPLCVHSGDVHVFDYFDDESTANAFAAVNGGIVKPLYASPPANPPEGWVMVPVESTEGMADAAREVSAGYPYKPAPDGERLGYLQVGLIWKAMLAASPPVSAK